MDFVFRRTTAADALTLNVLATQVFLDTCATNGISTAFAREADTVYSPEVFESPLRDVSVELLLAAAGECAVGFVDIAFATNCPVPGVHGAEVCRLYVQRPFSRLGLRRALIAKAEAEATTRDRGLVAVWLTAWVGNDRALAFYESLGYRDIGAMEYFIEGISHDNSVLCKCFAACAG